MKINVITLRSLLSKKDKEIDALTKSFLENINDELFDNDINLEINAENALISVFLIETGGSERKFLKYIDSLANPIILLSTERNNSLPACFEIKTYLENNGYNVLLLNGSEKDIASFFIKISDILTANEKLHHTTLGVIGNPSDWLISSVVDFGKVKDKFGISLLNIGTNELFDEIDKKKYGNVRNYSSIKQKAKNQAVLEMSLYIYGALKRLINKYHLSGFTIRCFDLLDEYKSTACLALGLLNEEGYICGCEGDIPAMLSMYLLYALTGRSSFMCNPSSINLHNLEITLAHCTIPFNMINRYELPTHFESNLGIGIQGTLSEGKITIFKLSSDLLGSNDLIIPASIKENLSLPGLCRTQILVSLRDVDMFEVIKQNYGNHVVVIYGDVTNDLFALVNLFKHKEI